MLTIDYSSVYIETHTRTHMVGKVYCTNKPVPHGHTIYTHVLTHMGLHPHTAHAYTYLCLHTQWKFIDNCDICIFLTVACLSYPRLNV